jgi:hypothetical protein
MFTKWRYVFGINFGTGSSCVANVSTVDVKFILRITHGLRAEAGYCIVGETCSHPTSEILSYLESLLPGYTRMHLLNFYRPAHKQMPE